jgi:large subunit ribosomal protein L24
VIAGGDKGKVGTIVALDTKRGMVVVEGINIKTKHVKPSAQVC